MSIVGFRVLRTIFRFEAVRTFLTGRSFRRVSRRLGQALIQGGLGNEKGTEHADSVAHGAEGGTVDGGFTHGYGSVALATGTPGDKSALEDDIGFHTKEARVPKHYVCHPSLPERTDIVGNTVGYGGVYSDLGDILEDSAVVVIRVGCPLAHFFIL